MRLNYIMRYARYKIFFSFSDSNEQQMKKRSQSPDSYTLSIILTALSKHPHPQTVVPKAIQILESMQRPESLVQPNHIHYNQVLQLCAKAGEIDSLWQILSTMPEKGPNAPSSKTFSIVLQNIKTSLELTNSKEDREELIRTAMNIWGIVADKWNKGIVTVDSHLVCDMVKVLVLGGQKDDYLNALDLIEQTTGERRPEISNRHRKQVKTTESNEDTFTRNEDDNSKALAPTSPSFAVVNRSPAAHGMQLVRPTVQILDAALWVCYHLKDAYLAKHYWDNLTSNNRVNVDGASFKVYLKVLREAKSSAITLDAMESFMEKHRPDWGMYRVAMSTIAATMPRKRAFVEAWELYKNRSQHLKSPDMKFMSQFVSGVLHHYQVCDLKTRQEALVMVGTDAVRALSSPGYGWMLPEEKTTEQVNALEEQTREVAQQIIGQIDKITNPNRIKKASLSSDPDDKHVVDAGVFEKIKTALDGFIREHKKTS
jgi:hypothetical protein